MGRPIHIIVREKAFDGAPIGPYLLYIRRNPSGLKVANIDPSADEKAEAVLKISNYQPVRVANLSVSDAILNRIRDQRQKAISHECTPAWEKALANNVEVVHLYSSNGNHAWIVVEQIRKQLEMRELRIRIFLGRILKL